MSPPVVSNCVELAVMLARLELLNTRPLRLLELSPSSFSVSFPSETMVKAPLTFTPDEIFNPTPEDNVAFPEATFIPETVKLLPHASANGVIEPNTIAVPHGLTVLAKLIDRLPFVKSAAKVLTLLE